MTCRTKIVCTLGPATGTIERIGALIDAGMDVARLNFSHGTHDDHLARYRAVRRAASERDRGVAVLADLQGPKIRLGRFAAGPVLWATGEHIVITTEDCPGDHDRVSTTYKGLSADAQPGDCLLIDDGRVELRVLAADGPDIRCEVTAGGPVSDRKGISVPDIPVSVPPLSDKDIEDLRYALEIGVDMIAMSFVRAPEEVKLARAVMEEVGRQVPVIAKLEKPEAVRNLAAIVDAFDGLMVARGDLGVEMRLEEVPLVQKIAIRQCVEAGKPVIVATQMLDSMATDPRPTRAEVSDVANAVLDGADAVMLSAETSVGEHASRAVATMASIASETERSIVPAGTETDHELTGAAIAAAAIAVGRRVGATALCCFTRTGDTARRLALQRSPLPLIAFTPDQEVRRRLALSWGVRAVALEPTDPAAMLAELSRILLSLGICREGDRVVVVFGARTGVPGATDSLRVLGVHGYDLRHRRLERDPWDE
ncbi:pyruvate kinase [Nocardia crassostreae]|uniref:pyruvate kinase n=1 Tax=Nocardia crassostreae TaxID=53428 RepID=UPI000829712B|nr:pyruvate kinase [Nocardia crassostreae]